MTFRHIILFLTVTASVGLAAEKNLAPLFQRDDYRFAIHSWKVEAAETGKKKVSLVVRYEIPKGTRFILKVARTPEDGASALAWIQIQDPTAGDLTFDIVNGDEGLRFYFGLWRGWPRDQSPSGVDCDGAFVDFSPRVVSVYK